MATIDTLSQNTLFFKSVDVKKQIFMCMKIGKKDIITQISIDAVKELQQQLTEIIKAQEQ